MEKTVKLVGMGCGPCTITAEAKKAIEKARLLIGSERMLDLCEEIDTEEGVRKVTEYRTEKIHDIIMEAAEERIAVLYSGDVTFYSGAPTLYQSLLHAKDVTAVMIPGISVMSYFASKLGIPCQGIRPASTHGADCDIKKKISGGDPVLFITPGENGPSDICRALKAAGRDDGIVTIGENLGYEDEKIEPYDVDEVIGRKYAKLNVLLFWG